MSRTMKRSRRPGRSASEARPVPSSPTESRIIREDTPGSHLPAGATRTPGAPPASSDKRGKYVYCIVRAAESLRFGPIGFGTPPGEVYTVLYEDIAAVVSDAPIEVLDATRENVLAHERVNEAVMKYQTVIPMSFGTVFKTRDDIVELLRGAHDAFQDVLSKMENKVEFGLKVLWDRDAMIRHLEHDDEDIRRLKSEIATQKGSTYFARVQYGRLVDGALQSRSEQYVAEIFEALRSVCVASRANKPIGDKMIMNAAFLVERDREGAFDARVKRFGAAYDTLTFRYTGPWPPYNFVNIRLKLERAK
jgi:Gas vesicle synthesis protein GvpL/GvpF